MTASPYCAACWARKQRPRAHYCDACNAPHVRERNRQSWLERRRQERDRLKAREATQYRAGRLSG